MKQITIKDHELTIFPVESEDALHITVKPMLTDLFLNMYEKGISEIDFEIINEYKRVYRKLPIKRIQKHAHTSFNGESLTILIIK
jgi:hypothetical protein